MKGFYVLFTYFISDSESSTHESDSDSNSGLQSVFYSVCDRKTLNSCNEHNISFNLDIKQGLLSMCAPVRVSFYYNWIDQTFFLNF